MLLGLLQQGTPDTAGFMIAGYLVIFGMLLGYLISLRVRRRNLGQDLEMLETFESEEGKRGSGG